MKTIDAEKAIFVLEEGDIILRHIGSTFYVDKQSAWDMLVVFWEKASGERKCVMRIRFYHDDKIWDSNDAKKVYNIPTSGKTVERIQELLDKLVGGCPIFANEHDEITCNIDADVRGPLTMAEYMEFLSSQGNMHKITIRKEDAEKERNN